MAMMLSQLHTQRPDFPVPEQHKQTCRAAYVQKDSGVGISQTLKKQSALHGLWWCCSCAGNHMI